MTEIKQPKNPTRKRTKKSTQSPPVDTGEKPAVGSEGGLVSPLEPNLSTSSGALIDEDANTTQALVLVTPTSNQDDDEAVVRRVEGLSRSAGWILISAGVVGLVVPGVLGTPFLILGGLALWPGNHKRVDRWRQGHSPKMFHGAMKQINRFLDDLEKRYPYVDKP